MSFLPTLFLLAWMPSPHDIWTFPPDQVLQEWDTFLWEVTRTENALQSVKAHRREYHEDREAQIKGYRGLLSAIRSARWQYTAWWETTHGDYSVMGWSDDDHQMVLRTLWDVVARRLTPCPQGVYDNLGVLYEALGPERYYRGSPMTPGEFLASLP